MKTAEEKARELYLDGGDPNELRYVLAKKQQEAFVKGYQRRCLEEQTEMGEYSVSQSEQVEYVMKAAENIIQKWKGKCAITSSDIQRLEKAMK